MKDTAGDEMELGAAGVATRAARVALILVWITGILHGLLRSEFSASGWLGALAYLAAVAAAILLTVRHDGPLRRREAIGLLSLLTLVVLVVLAYADIDEREASVVWLLNFSSYLLALAIARGNPVIGGIGIALQVLLVTAWGIATGQQLDGVIDMLTLPVAAAVGGTSWLILFRMIVRRERRARSVSEEAELSTKAAADADQAAVQELAGIARVVAPLLRRIAASTVIDDALVRELTATEGGIRDRIRAAEFSHPALVHAVNVARERGVHVLLLGSDEDDEPISEALAECLIRVLAGPEVHSVTMRVLSGGEGSVSVVVQGPGASVDRVLFDRDGLVV